MGGNVDHRVPEGAGTMRTNALLVLGILIGAEAIGAVAATSSGSGGAVERSRCGSSPNRSKTAAWKLDCSSDRTTASGARRRSRRCGSCLRTPRLANRCTAHRSWSTPTHDMRWWRTTTPIISSNWAKGPLIPSRSTSNPKGSLRICPLMLCVEDLNDPGIGQLCEGMESAWLRRRGRASLLRRLR